MAPSRKRPALKVKIPSRKIASETPGQDFETASTSVSAPSPRAIKVPPKRVKGQHGESLVQTNPLPTSSTKNQTNPTTLSQRKQINVEITLSETRGSENTMDFTQDLELERAEFADKPKLIDSTTIIREKLTPIIEESQHVSGEFTALLKEFQDLYNQCSKTDFNKVLFRHMAPMFNDKDSKTNPYLIDMYKFFILAVNKTKGEGEDPLRVPSLLQEGILRLAFRYRCLMGVLPREKVYDTVNQILRSIGKDEIPKMPEELARHVVGCLQGGLSNKHSKVRMASAFGLQFFLPSVYDPSLGVLKDLIHCLRHDPSAEVRKMATLVMPLGEEVYELLYERVGDYNEDVRVAAFVVIKKHNLLEKLPLVGREEVIYSGLTDASRRVKEKAVEVLKSYLEKSCEQNHCLLLSKFDVLYRKTICTLILHAVLPMDFPTRGVDLSFLENHVIPFDNLTPENLFLWVHLATRCPAQVMRPNASEMMDYISAFAEYMENKYPDTEPASESILKDYHVCLNGMMSIMLPIYLEEGGRRKLLAWISEMAKRKDFHVPNVKVLVALLHRAQPDNSDAAVDNLLQTFLDANTVPTVLLAPPPPTTKTKIKKPRPDRPRRSLPRNLEIPRKIRELQIEKGGLALKKHKYYNEFDKATKEKDYTAAQQIKEQMDLLQEAQKKIQDRIQELESELAIGDINAEESSDKEMSFEDDYFDISSEEEEIEPAIQVSVPSYSEKGLCLAFTVLAHHLQIKRIRNPPVFVQIFLDNHISKAFVGSGTYESQILRMNALKVLTICTCANPEEVNLACLSRIVKALQFDVPNVANTAYQALFDLVLMYGFDKLKDANINLALGSVKSPHEVFKLDDSVLYDSDDNSSASRISVGLAQTSLGADPNEDEDNISDLQHLIIHQLINPSVHPEVGMTGIKGIMKLLLARRLKDGKLLVPLLLIWANPENDKTQIFREINAFVVLYAKQGVDEALHIVQSLNICFKKISCAKRDSTLKKASKDVLLKFIALSTSPAALKDYLDKPSVPHEVLARTVIESLDDCQSHPHEDIEAFVKSLKYISLEGASLEMLTNMYENLPRIRRKVPHGLWLPISSFRRYVEYLKDELIEQKNASASPVAENTRVETHVGTAQPEEPDGFSIDGMDVTFIGLYLGQGSDEDDGLIE